MKNVIKKQLEKEFNEGISNIHWSIDNIKNTIVESIKNNKLDITSIGEIKEITLDYKSKTVLFQLLEDINDISIVVDNFNKQMNEKG